MKKNESKVIQASMPTNTVADLIRSLDSEIDDIKAGTLNESKARVIAKNRQLQLHGFQLVLAAARLEATYRPELARRIGTSEPPDEEDSKEC